MKIVQPGDSLTLQHAHQQLKLLEGLSGDVTVDLSGVNQIDSAAVALLLHWLRAAQLQYISLQFTGLPESLTRLLHVYDLDSLLATGQAELQAGQH
ncbi:STAS domain-containing protein [Chitinilyticum piscinae]|uniref:STAS domain-containing protein n=1 Tax=Chitinilyticum piscinae TaxID=2866724 RepID=A0A8J7K0X6_9NEIS|nr:STAS domain-containing protein [Chitinilyticum piscinae]MBE9607762.1 STAS domain-containing protein [Chitinilyticum piscinae]